MEDTDGHQYALQVTVQTMKERCLQLQQRLALVEEENMQLRIKYNADYLELSDVSNKSELEMLREKVAQLTKQKSQLTHNVLMVATENRHLWNRLSKLTQANQTLGSHIHKINDTMNSNSPNSPSSPTSPSNLIRSRTFTHENPPVKLVPKMDKELFVDTSLEDISLKILNNIVQEKSELEKQCAQMAELHSNGSYIQSSIGFAYPKEDMDNCDSDITQHLDKLKYIKERLLIHRDKLNNNMELFRKLHDTGIFCKRCKEKSAQDKNKVDEVTTTNINSKPKKYIDTEDRICPMCNKIYPIESLDIYIKHVEQHFTATDLDSFDLELF